MKWIRVGKGISKDEARHSAFRWPLDVVMFGFENSVSIGTFLIILDQVERFWNRIVDVCNLIFMNTDRLQYHFGWD